jgi:hypothetical protein
VSLTLPTVEEPLDVQRSIDLWTVHRRINHWVDYQQI